MSLKSIQSADAPAPVGPYSQAISAGGLVFCAGQIALKPDTGALVSGGVAAEADQVLKNLQAVLTAAGSSLQKVVRTDIFLLDMADFQAVNEVYATYFNHAPQPARQTVGVASLPKGAKVEISCIATTEE